MVPGIEQIIEHHMKLNMGQKITPHLICGIAHLVRANCEQLGLLKKEETPSEPKKDTDD